MTTTNTLQQAGFTTEEDIASYLISTPEFFERFAEVLASVQLINPQASTAVSLQERQVGILREKVKKLEAAIVEMMGYGSENAQIIKKVYGWTCALIQIRHAADLPSAIVSGLQQQFDVPQVFLHLWDVDALYADLPEAQNVPLAAQQYAQTLEQPYCGLRGGIEGLQGLAGEGADIAGVQSLAVLPLRYGSLEDLGRTFGYVVLASPDAHRYTPDMRTELLVRLAELSSAALQRLLPPQWQEEAERQRQQSLLAQGLEAEAAEAVGDAVAHAAHEEATQPASPAATDTAPAEPQPDPAPCSDTPTERLPGQTAAAIPSAGS